MTDNTILNNNVLLDRFENLTKYNISYYFARINVFFANYRRNIEAWYSGSTNIPDANAFNLLYSLIDESNNLQSLFDRYRDSFDNAGFWELLDLCDNIQLQLIYTSNLSKFLRSTKTRNSFLSSAERNYTMVKYDTIEKVQRNEVSLNDFDNQWANLAIRSDLKEIDYDINGGKSLRVPLIGSSFVNIESVVDDTISGEKIYGLDINKKLTFVSFGISTKTGSITCSKLTYVVTGIGTSFTTELKKGDFLKSVDGVVLGVVDSITSNTNLAFESNSLNDYVGGFIVSLGEDLEVLSYKETALQSLNILSNIKKESVPEFPLLGLDQAIAVGSSMAAFRAPTIVREMGEVFATDDSFVNFAVLNIKKDQDAVSIDYQVDTVYGVIQKQITV